MDILRLIIYKKGLDKIYNPFNMITKHSKIKHFKNHFLAMKDKKIIIIMMIQKL